MNYPGAKQPPMPQGHKKWGPMNAQSDLSGNPLRLFLDGLKSVPKSSDVDCGNSRESLYSSSSELQPLPVPQMLVPNQSIQGILNRIPHTPRPASKDAMIIDVEFEPNEKSKQIQNELPNFPIINQHSRPPQQRVLEAPLSYSLDHRLKLPSASSSVLNHYTAIDNNNIINKVDKPINGLPHPLSETLPQLASCSGRHQNRYQTFPSMQTVPFSSEVLHGMTKNSIFINQPCFVQLPSLYQQQHACFQRPPEQYRLLLQPSPSLPHTRDYLPKPTSHQILNQIQNSTQRTNTPTSRPHPVKSHSIPSPKSVSTVNTHSTVNLHSSILLQPSSYRVDDTPQLQSPPSRTCQFPQLPKTQGQSPLVKKQGNAGNLEKNLPQSSPLMLVQAPSYPLQGSMDYSSNAKDRENIEMVLTGFKQMLEKKSSKIIETQGSQYCVSVCSSSKTGTEMPSNEGSSSISNSSRFSTSSTNDEQLNPKVKSEVINLGDEDDDCLVTMVDFSEKIFVLQKEHHGVTIDLSGTENENAVIENEPIRVKMESDEAVTIENEPVIIQVSEDNSADELADMQIVSSSSNVVTPTTIDQPETKEGVSLISQSFTEINGNNNKNNFTNSSVHGGNEKLLMNKEGKEIHLYSSTQNVSSNLHHSSIDTFGTVLKSFQENGSNASNQSHCADSNSTPNSRKLSFNLKSGSSSGYTGQNAFSLKTNRKSNANDGYHEEDLPSSSNCNSNCIISQVTKKCYVSLKRTEIGTSSLSLKSTLNRNDLQKSSTGSSQSYGAQCVEVVHKSPNSSNDKANMINSSPQTLSILKKNCKPDPMPNYNRGAKRLKTKSEEGFSAESSQEKVGDSSSTNKRTHRACAISSSPEHNGLGEDITRIQNESNGNERTTNSMYQRDKLESGVKIKKAHMSTSDPSSELDDNTDDGSDRMSITSCSSISDSTSDEDVEYLCKLCSKSYSKRSHLKKHMTTHYKGVLKKVEKKVMCKGCRKKFSDTTALQAHLLQHRYCFFDCTRPYWKKKGSSLKACRMCGKGQAKWKDLKKHFYRDLTCRLRFIDLILERSKRYNNAKLDTSTECKTSQESNNVRGISKSSIELGENFSEGSQKEVSESGLQSMGEKQFSETLLDHEESMNSSGCSSCEGVFKTVAFLSQHLNENDVCKKFYLDSKNNSCLDKIDYCPMCSMFMANKFELWNHMCCNRSTTCNICLGTFSDERGVRVHKKRTPCGMISAEDLEQVTEMRRNAGKGFLTVGDDSDSQTKPKLLNCDVCGKLFKHIRDLLDHSYSHTDLRNSDCLDCSLTFKCYSSHVFHMISHDKKLKFENGDEYNKGIKQPIVNMPFQPSSTKQLPSSSTDPIVTFKCPHCPVRFKSKLRYDAHVYIHGAKRKKDKTACHFTKAKSAKLDLVKSGSNDMKFSCFQCNQQFSTLRGKKVHSVICGARSQLEKSSRGTNGGHVCANDDAEDAVTSTSDEIFEPNYKCSLCFSVISKKSFWYHFKSHKESIAAGVRSKMKQSLGDQGKAVCAICGHKYPTNQILLEHIKTHKPRSIMRPVNGSFQSPWKQSHANPSNIPEISEKSSTTLPTSSQKTVVHKLAYNVCNNFSCTICNKIFLSIPLFKAHLKIAHKHSKLAGWSNFVNYLQQQQTEDYYDEKAVEELDTERADKNKLNISIASLVTSGKASHSNSKSTGVMCEICNKEIHKSYRPKHMQVVHGLPKSAFLVRPRKENSIGFNVKKEIENVTDNSHHGGHSKYPFFPRIEVDMGGANIITASDTDPVPVQPFSTSTMQEADPFIECMMCGQSFTNRGLRWKHIFSHTKPCSVTLVRLDEIIQIPSGLEDGIANEDPIFVPRLSHSDHVLSNQRKK